MCKCMQRGGLGAEIIDLGVSCIAVQNVRKLRDYKVFNWV